MSIKTQGPESKKKLEEEQEVSSKMVQMIQALVNQVEQITTGHFSKHKEANKKLISELKSASSMLAGMTASVKNGDENQDITEEQLKVLMEKLPKTTTPVFPPSLRLTSLPKKEEK